MKYYASASVIGMIGLILANPVWAGSTVLCPDISQAKQVAECPDEAEVKRMFKVSCGFERDPSSKKPELCDSYEEFKRRKYTALWESSDGDFMGYLSCVTPAEKIKMSKPSSVAVSQKNGLYKLACNYQGGVALTMRTRSVCRVPGVKGSEVVMRADCGADGSNCKVECD